MTSPLGSTPIGGAGSFSPGKCRQILDALRDRLELILTGNSYTSNLGQNVQEWDLTPLDQNLETSRIEFRGGTATMGYEAVGEWLWKFPVELRIQFVGEELPLNIMNGMMADVLWAVSHDADDNLDTTFGGIAEDMNPDGDWVLDKGQAADTATGARCRLMIEFVTQPWNSYV